MRSKLYIGEFARLNRLSVKTVIHYHKLGLLPECGRSPAGYRLYGLDDMKRILLIRRLKELGLSLKQIGCLVADSDARKLLQEYLKSREQEITGQIRTLESQLASVRMMMAQHSAELSESLGDPPSYQYIRGALGRELYESNPGMARQEKQLCEILDGYEWDTGHEQLLSDVAAHFQNNPDLLQRFVDLGIRLHELAAVPANSLEVEELARDYATALAELSIPGLPSPGSYPESPFASLMDEMLQDALSPSQARFMELCHSMLKPSKEE